MKPSLIIKRNLTNNQFLAVVSHQVSVAKNQTHRSAIEEVFMERKLSVDILMHEMQQMVLESKSFHFEEKWEISALSCFFRCKKGCFERN